MNLTTDREIEITQTEIHTHTQNESKPNGAFRCCGITSNSANMCITGISEERRGKKAECTCEEIMAKKFPK